LSLLPVTSTSVSKSFISFSCRPACKKAYSQGAWRHVALLPVPPVIQLMAEMGTLVRSRNANTLWRTKALDIQVVPGPGYHGRIPGWCMCNLKPQTLLTCDCNSSPISLPISPTLTMCFDKSSNAVSCFLHSIVQC
jgi:hypothetical protein